MIFRQILGDFTHITHLKYLNKKNKGYEPKYLLLTNEWIVAVMVRVRGQAGPYTCLG